MENNNDLSKLEPWNSGENKIKVNSIRYNNDYTLFCLGTSQGYRIFSTNTLKQLSEENEKVNNLGDIFISMVYFQSSLVFFLPSSKNPNFSSKEFIIFDDSTHEKICSFKEKHEEFLNFLVSKNVIFLISLSKIIVIELCSFNVIDIIDNINSMNKLLSFNSCDFIAYSLINDKKKVFIKYYNSEKNKVKALTKKEISSNFEYIQTIQLSPSGDAVGVVSIFGNKIHIYNTQNGKLKSCLFLGQNILSVDKLLFSEKKANYIFILKNDNRFNIYKLNKKDSSSPKCVCDKYDDKNITSEGEGNKSKSGGIFGFFRKISKNKDVCESHAFSSYENKAVFIDFDRNQKKDIIIIDNLGKITKFHYNKKPSGSLSPTFSIQWE